MGKTKIKDYRVVIVGPGAMGCLLGGFLGRSGLQVWLLDKRRERAEVIARQGIRIEGVSGEHRIRVKATVDPEDTGKPWLIIVCVKSYDTPSAAGSIQEMIGKDTLVLTLQNGWGNLEQLAAVIDPAKLIGGITSQGATLLGPGHIRHAGTGETVIGRYLNRGQKSEVRRQRTEDRRQKLEEVAEIFNQAGIPVRIAENVEDLIWSKLVINAGINALGALTRLNNGRLPEFAETKKILRLAVEEAAAVGRAKRVKLIFENPAREAEKVCQATSENVCSMLQDVLRKKRTEVDCINGAVVREGRKLKVPVPVNEVLTALVKTLEESYHLRLERV